MLKKIIQETQNKIKEDNTIAIGQNMTDCNKRVIQSAIALRELIIYSDIDEDDKDIIQDILNNYGMMFENEEERLYTLTEEIAYLLGDDYTTTINAIKTDPLNIFTHNNIEIMEKIIRKILIKFYRPYSIPTTEYDKIMYKHSTDICDTIRQHHKSLRNPLAKWDAYDKYDITVNYRDIKIILLEARDSGGNMDCFNFAHYDTLMNCVVSFVGEKLNIEYELGYGFYNSFKNITNEQKDELYNICEDIYSIALNKASDFRIETY